MDQNWEQLQRFQALMRPSGALNNPVFLFLMILAATGALIVAARMLHAPSNPDVVSTSNTPGRIDKDGALVLDYAAVIGRARACGVRTEKNEVRVSAWIERSFPAKRAAVYRAMFRAAVDLQEQRQIRGETGDSCIGIHEAFGAMSWP